MSVVVLPFFSTLLFPLRNQKAATGIATEVRRAGVFLGWEQAIWLVLSILFYLSLTYWACHLYQTVFVPKYKKWLEKTSFVVPEGKGNLLQEREGQRDN